MQQINTLTKYLLIGGGVSGMSFFLVPQDFLRVYVESLQLLDQMVLLGCMFCTLSVQALYLCTFLASRTNTQIQVPNAVNAAYRHAQTSSTNILVDFEAHCRRPGYVDRKASALGLCSQPSSSKKNR